jgi:nucleoside-diphosphate-sugar epimerase
MTSSFAAIGYGHAVLDKPFDETTWTDLAGPGLSAYVKSKTIAERAAWNFITKEGGGLELSVVNPVGVLGPALGEDLATSVLLVQRLLNGSVPGCPRLYFGVVDVRDVADLHLRCMTHPAAKGERFIATAGDSLSVRELALALRSVSARQRGGFRRASSPIGWCASRPCSIPPSGTPLASSANASA